MFVQYLGSTTEQVISRMRTVLSLVQENEEEEQINYFFWRLGMAVRGHLESIYSKTKQQTNLIFSFFSSSSMFT